MKKGISERTKKNSYLVPIGCEYSQLQLDSRSRIGKLKEQITECSNAMDAWKNEIHSTCEADKPDIGYLKTLIRFYENEVSKFASYHERLDQLYQKEMSDLIHINRPDKLPSSLSEELGKEYDLLMTKIDIGLQQKDESLSLQLFSEQNLVKLRNDLYNECPLLADVFKVLFLHVEDNRESNRKQLTVAHAVSLLMSLRNKTAHNDVRLVFL